MRERREYIELVSIVNQKLFVLLLWDGYAHICEHKDACYRCKEESLTKCVSLQNISQHFPIDHLWETLGWTDRSTKKTIIYNIVFSLPSLQPFVSILCMCGRRWGNEHSCHRTESNVEGPGLAQTNQKHLLGFASSTRLHVFNITILLSVCLHAYNTHIQTELIGFHHLPHIHESLLNRAVLYASWSHVCRDCSLQLQMMISFVLIIIILFTYLSKPISNVKVCAYLNESTNSVYIFEKWFIIYTHTSAGLSLFQRNHQFGVRYRFCLVKKRKRERIPMEMSWRYIKYTSKARIDLKMEGWRWDAGGAKIKLQLLWLQEIKVMFIKTFYHDAVVFLCCLNALFRNVLCKTIASLNGVIFWNHMLVLCSGRHSITHVIWNKYK